jgi:hypothetical protein
MSCPDPLQEHYAEDLRSMRERLEQEIKGTTELLVAMTKIYGGTIARLRDELDELDSD